MKKILSLAVITVLIGMGLIGCARTTPPTLPEKDSVIVPSTSTASATQRTGSGERLAQVQGGSTPSAMTPTRLFFVVINGGAPELAAVADSMATQLNGTRGELYPELNGFMLRTPGQVLQSDILRDKRVKYVLADGGQLHTPPAITQSGAASDKKKASATGKSKSTAKKSTKNAKSAQKAKPTKKS